MAPATELLDELTEEIFLRIHPADAATLVRAALACKRWCRLIADPGFRRRFRRFHRAPPILGFSCNVVDDIPVGNFYFLPSTAARFVCTSSCLRRVDMERSRVVDTRHGRILLHRASCPWKMYLFVWDPITKEEHELPEMPRFRGALSWSAAVFCTAAGCDHLDCHGKPFAVVFLATCTYLMFNFVYSSEAGRWSEVKVNHPLAKHPLDNLMLVPSALVGDAIIYFVLQRRAKILKCNISSREMSVIDLPPACFIGRSVLLMAMEDSVLGFATVRESKLYLWSRDGNSDKGAGWAQRRVIDLKTLLPIGALLTPPDVVGFADGIGFIFLKTNSGHFRIDLKSGSVKKLHTVGDGSIIFPYMSFHTPALGAAAASTGEGPSTGASSASKA